MCELNWTILLPYGPVKLLAAAKIGFYELPTAVVVRGIGEDGLPVHRQRQVGGNLQNIRIIRGSVESQAQSIAVCPLRKEILWRHNYQQYDIGTSNAEVWITDNN